MTHVCETRVVLVFLIMDFRVGTATIISIVWETHLCALFMDISTPTWFPEKNTGKAVSCFESKFAWMSKWLAFRCDSARIQAEDPAQTFWCFLSDVTFSAETFKEQFLQEEVITKVFG